MQRGRGSIYLSAGRLILFSYLSEYKVCLFVAHLADDGLQHSSINGYLSAVRRMQIVDGLGDPFVASWPVLECALKGIKLRQAKKSATRPRPHLPVTPAILRRLCRFWEAEKHNPDHIMLWAACCMCFFGFLQSGEVTVPSLREYDPEGLLSEGDVTLDSLSAPTLVQVRVKASKTNPFRKGVAIYLVRTDNDMPIRHLPPFWIVTLKAS